MSPRSREHIDARLADLRQAAANALHSAAHGGYRGRPSELRNILTDLLAVLDESDEAARQEPDDRYDHYAPDDVQVGEGMVVDIDGEIWTYTDDDGWTCPEYAQHVTLAGDIASYDFNVVNPGVVS